MHAMSAVEIPELLGGRYRVVRALGAGAFATTWLAVRVADGLEVAIKEIPVRGDPKRRELIAREARVLRELEHPDIPRFVEDFEVGDGRLRTHCVVQEYIAGPTLAQAMIERRFTADEILALLRTLLPVLDYLHTRSPPVIHRDLKPENLIFRPNGRLALVDFGSVRDAHRGTLGGTTITGTFGYMAPEQFQGDASPATDRYALGMLAVALATRKDPAAMHAIDGGFAWRRHASVPDEVAGLIDALIAPDPKARPRSAGDIAQRIDALAKGAQTANAPPPTPGPRIHQPLAKAQRSWADREAKAIVATRLAGLMLVVLALPIPFGIVIYYAQSRGLPDDHPSPPRAEAQLASAPTSRAADPPAALRQPAPRFQYLAEPPRTRAAYALQRAAIGGIAMNADPHVQACFAAHPETDATSGDLTIDGNGAVAFVGVWNHPLADCIAHAAEKLYLGATIGTEQVLPWTVRRIAPFDPAVPVQRVGESGGDSTLVLGGTFTSRLVIGDESYQYVIEPTAGPVRIEGVGSGWYATTYPAGPAARRGFTVLDHATCRFAWTGSEWAGGCSR
jgi:serine/threonine protein kinase